MAFQVRVKLRLSKEKRRFHVEYHTFEKATFDRYLLASLALHAKDETQALSYIDESTGEGSLNSYFKKLYHQSAELGSEALQGVIENSLYPILKVDESHWYEYYDAINASVFKKRAYSGDLKNEDHNSLLMIREPLIEKRIVPEKTFEKPEPYLVKINDNGDVKVFIENMDFDISAADFENLLVNELSTITKYQGTIHTKATGMGWSILSDSVINNLFSNADYYYNADGDICLVRSDGVKCTTIVKIAGLYIYRETKHDYYGNRGICKKAYETLKNNYSLSTFPSDSLAKMIRQFETRDAVEAVNYYFSQVKKFVPQIARIGYELLNESSVGGWNKSSLQFLLEKADPNQLVRIYRVDPTLNYSISQLLCISNDLLSDEHKKQVQEYQTNVQNIQAEIREIVGEVTTSGLRERAKQLQSDLTTKKFTKACNQLIGHVQNDLSKASLEQAQEWLEKAKELKELSLEIEKKLQTNI